METILYTIAGTIIVLVATVMILAERSDRKEKRVAAMQDLENRLRKTTEQLRAAEFLLEKAEITLKKVAKNRDEFQAHHEDVHRKMILASEMGAMAILFAHEAKDHFAKAKGKDKEFIDKHADAIIKKAEEDVANEIERELDNVLPDFLKDLIKKVKNEGANVEVVKVKKEK